MDPKHDRTTNEATPRRSRSSKKSEPTPQAEMKIHKAEDDVLDVIEHVESQLGALRKAHEDHRKVMSDLSARRREIEDQAEELESRESELTNREVELAEMRQDFETRELNLVQRASGLEQRESKIASQAERLEQHEAELEARDRTLEGKINELDNQLAGLAKRKGELRGLEEEIKEKIAREDASAKKLEVAIKELESARASIEQMNEQSAITNTELGELRAGFESVSEQLSESQSAHAVSAKELKSAESKLRGREIELGERSHTLEELAEKAGTLEHELEHAREQFKVQLGDAQDLLDAKAKESQKLQTKLEAQLEAIETQRAEERAQSERALEELVARLEESHKQIESLKASAATLGAQSAGRVDELTSELEAARVEAQALREQVNEIAQCADEELTSERARIAEFEAQIESLSTELASATAKRDALETELGSKPEIEPEELKKLESLLAETKESSAQSLSRLEETQLALDKSLGELAARDELISEADERINELEKHSSELSQTLETLSAELEESRSTPKVEVDEWCKNRRARLGKMRRIMTGDAEKIRLATNALRTRYEQCEQVLTKRAELAQAYEAIASAQRKYQTREVRSGVFLGLLGLAAMTLVLAATSWFVSGRVSPGIYAARVTMAAASGDQALTEAGMAQWESYITELTKDPRFIEVAADRMKRRGIGQFAVAGDLAKEMSQSLDVESAMPGTLVMEYRGLGAERSQRILDTFAVALASAANNARARRADSAMTAIEESAKAGDEPLDHRRIQTAGIIFGFGALLTLVAGGVLWKRLSAAKARFEKDSRIEGLFDDSRWQLPG